MIAGTHGVNPEHGGEGKVALVCVDYDREGRRSDVPESAHDGEREHRCRRGDHERVEVAAGVMLQRLPHAAPSVDAREAEHGRVEARRKQPQETTAPRRRKPSLQRRLRKAEQQVQRAPNHQRDPRAQRRVLQCVHNASVFSCGRGFGGQGPSAVI